MKTYEKVQALNDHYENLGYHDSMIYSFDEDTINELIPNPWEALRASHFGVKHLDNQKFPGIAEMDFKSASEIIDQMLLIKDQLNFINPIINRMLYPKD